MHQRRGVQEVGVQNIDECRGWYKNDFGARGTSAGGGTKTGVQVNIWARGTKIGVQVPIWAIWG